MNLHKRNWTEPNPRWFVPAICIFLAAVTWVVFGQTIRHGFVNYDDPNYVYDNAQVVRGLTAHGIVWALIHVHAHNWHPLTWASHMLDCQFYGLNAGGHHFTNVVLHATAVILLFLVLSAMTGATWRTAFVAALFAIHPLRVESVAWVAERKDVLSGVFFMLTLGAYLRYVRNPPSGSRYLLVALLFGLGLMSKPMLVTTPFVLLLLDYWPLGRFSGEHTRPRVSSATPSSWTTPGRSGILGSGKIPAIGGGANHSMRGACPPGKRLLAEKIPLFALSAVSCMLTVLAQKGTIISTEKSPLAGRINNAAVAYVEYIWQMIHPVRLAPFYPRETDQLSLFQITFCAGLIVLITLIAVVLRKKKPYVIVGWLWYLGMLVPVIGLVHVGMQARADRYTYLPQIGLYLLVTWGVAEISTSWHYRRTILATAAIVIIVVLSWFAWVQTSYWRDSESLWIHTLAVTSDNDVAHNNFGNVLREKGQNEEALSHYEKAVNIRPWNVPYQNNLARALAQKGDVEAAIAHLRTSLQNQPKNPLTLNFLGAVLFQAGRVSEAIARWEEVLRIQPADWEAINRLAWVYATYPDPLVRNGSRAKDLAEKALRFGGPNPLPFRTLAAAYAETGQYAEAIETARRGLDLAVAQRNFALAEDLRSNIALYQINSPLREPSSPH